MKIITLALSLNLLLSACSPGSGHGSGEGKSSPDPILEKIQPSDQASVDSALGQRLVSGDWCDQYSSDLGDGIKYLDERTTFAPDSTFQIKRSYIHGGVRVSAPPQFGRWSFEGDRLNMYIEHACLKMTIQLIPLVTYDCHDTSAITLEVPGQQTEQIFSDPAAGTLGKCRCNHRNP